MYKERVALRVVLHHGTVGSEGVARAVVVPEVVARHGVLVHRIVVHHVAKALAYLGLVVVEQAVGGQRLAVVLKRRTAIQAGEILVGVVISLRRVDDACARRDFRRPHDVRQRRARVVVQGVGFKHELRIFQVHRIVEHGLTRLRIVLSPVRNKHVVLVYHLAALEKIAYAIQAVVVKAVGVELGLAVGQHHVVARLGHLVVAVVIRIVAEQRQSVALIHPNMPEGAERIAFLIEVSAVAIQLRPLMTEGYVSVEHLRTGHGTELVEAQPVGVNEINTLVGLWPRLLLWCLARLHQPKSKKAQDCQNQYPVPSEQSLYFLVCSHLTQPSYLKSQLL